VINVSRNHSDVCRLLGRWCSLGASSGALVKYTKQQGALEFDAVNFSENPKMINLKKAPGASIVACNCFIWIGRFFIF
jgi:hypothetical protein